MNNHSTQQDYEHFLAYSGLKDDPFLIYAYFHGAGADCPLPSAADQCDAEKNAQAVSAP